MSVALFKNNDVIAGRITRSSTPGYVPYTVNDDNQYTIMRDVSLTYDVAGNVNTYASWTYSWDNENRLTQVVSTSKLIKFTYDTQGRRIEKKVWNNTTGTGTPITYLKYIYDGWNLIVELNGNSNAVVRTYSWGPEAQGVPGTLRMISDSNGVYFPAYDPNGNVMGLVKASDGTVCAQYEYLPYGEEISATGVLEEEYSSGGELIGYSGVYEENPIRFSTKYRDNETGLYYYGYRYYSPDTGRWISRDPIEEQGGLNLYGFVNNDPVNRVDWLGLECEEYIVSDKSHSVIVFYNGSRWSERKFNYRTDSLINKIKLIEVIEIEFKVDVKVLCKCPCNEWRYGTRVYKAEKDGFWLKGDGRVFVPIGIPSNLAQGIVGELAETVAGSVDIDEVQISKVKEVLKKERPKLPWAGDWEDGISPCKKRESREKNYFKNFFKKII